MIGALGLRASAVDSRDGDGSEPTPPGPDHRLLPCVERRAAGRPEDLSCMAPKQFHYRTR